MKKIALFLFNIIFLVSCSFQFSFVKMMTFKVYYDFGTIASAINSETGEITPVVTILYNDGQLDSSFQISLDCKYDYFVPGDKINIQYTGEVVCQTSYPSLYILKNGKVKQVNYLMAKIKQLNEEDIARNEEGIIQNICGLSIENCYIVLNNQLDFIPLAQYTGTDIYVSYSSNEPNLMCGFFAFNPRK